MTNLERYWANLTNEGGVPTNVTLYNASTGQLVIESSVIQRVKMTDTNLSGFNWIVPSTPNTSSQTSPNTIFESVVDVPIGDTWADYRPARPQDFVGREDVQVRISDFLRAVQNKETNTRLFSIRAPSGWGKSSLVAKLRDKCRNKFNRNKFYMSAVDMRAAKSPNYISAALLRTFSSAKK